MYFDWESCPIVFSRSQLRISICGPNFNYTILLDCFFTNSLNFVPGEKFILKSIASRKIRADVLHPSLMPWSDVDVDIQDKGRKGCEGFNHFCINQSLDPFVDRFEELLTLEEVIARRVVFLRDTEQVIVFNEATELHPDVVIVVPLSKNECPFEILLASEPLETHHR